ncbi:MAG TPA: sodium:solute symporter family protein [Terriglobia bacterium]|nr:sodium:solute symporter family protein [Terriglobia bacterium]
MHFHPLDWVIVIVYLAGTMAAGLYGKKYVSGLSDFLVAGRQLGTFIGIATLAATEIGTITFMYYAELGYKTGFASFVNGLIAGAVMIFIGRTGFIIRRLRALGLMTIPEFFQVKYSKNLRVLTGILVATGGILNMGVFLKVEGTFLAIISGISLDHLKATMTAILLLELVYTVLGGMVSIVITDFLQFIALSLGTILVTLYSIHVVGWGHMRDTVYTNMGSQGFNPFTNAQYGWAYIAFQILLWMSVDTCWQTTAMRTFSMRDAETSKKVFSWTGFLYLGRGMMPMLWGIAALAMLGPNVNSLEAMPVMLTRILPVGILGLVVSGMLAATMSVNSSYLLGWSAIIAQDIILPLRKKPLSSRSQVLLNRLANLFVSLFVLFWGIWYTLPGPTYFYLNITASIFLAGTFAAVIGGLFWSRANTLGGYCAMIAGAIGAVAFFFFRVPASYAGLGSFALAGVAMIVGSLLGKSGTPRYSRGAGKSPVPA